MLKPNQTLTKELLESYPPHYVFFDSTQRWPGTTASQMDSLRFVAKKNAGMTWQIQYGYLNDKQEVIIDFAPKMVRDKDITALIPCTAEVLSLYLK